MLFRLFGCFFFCRWPRPLVVQTGRAWATAKLTRTTFKVNKLRKKHCLSAAIAFLSCAIKIHCKSGSPQVIFSSGTLAVDMAHHWQASMQWSQMEAMLEADVALLRSQLNALPIWDPDLQMRLRQAEFEFKHVQRPSDLKS